LPPKYAVIRPDTSRFGTFKSGIYEYSDSFGGPGSAAEPTLFARVRPRSGPGWDGPSSKSTESADNDEPIIGRPWSLSLNSDRTWRCLPYSGD
jgi:hypothetical protein